MQAFINKCIMRIKIITFSIFLSVILISCSTKEITPLVLSEELLVNNKVSVRNGCFNTALIYDSLLILIAECDSNYFHIYNKNTLNFIWKFGKKGRGPVDFNFPFPYTNTNLNEEKYIFYDLNIPKESFINFNKVVTGHSLSDCISTKVIDVNLFSCNELNFIENNRVIGQDLDKSEGLFFIYDTKLKKKEWINYIPKFKIKSKYRNSVYTGSLCSDGETIVFSPRHFDLVLFFNSQGNLFKEYNFSKIKKPILSKQFSGVDYNSLLYTHSIYGTKEYCYILRINKSITDLSDNRNYPTQILKFDWNGNLINANIIKSLPSSFCVDESSSTLYCIFIEDQTSEFVQIAKLSLK